MFPFRMILFLLFLFKMVLFLLILFLLKEKVKLKNLDFLEGCIRCFDGRSLKKVPIPPGVCMLAAVEVSWSYLVAPDWFG
jgi:hypothetical protein